METAKYLKNNFSYCFKKKYDYEPIIKLRKLKKRFKIFLSNKPINFLSIPVKHGLINSIAYIIDNKVAYLSDANEISLKDIKHFKKLKYLIIDCLRIKKHPSHFSLNEVIKLFEILKPNKMILTNLHSDLDYDYLIKVLPKKIIPGYDGLTLTI